MLFCYVFFSKLFLRTECVKQRIQSNKYLSMKYLLVEDKLQQGQAILDSIAEFLWNNGNEIYASNNFHNQTDYLDIAECCDCIVLLFYRECPVDLIFGSGEEISLIDKELGKIVYKKVVLVFSENGVFCNAIPFPHKIFHLEGLCQDELARFFNWCVKLSLFTKSLSYSIYPNFQYL